jgi:dihydrodipicolinate synthase/N-acetylneuraminate lyase
MIGGVIPVLYSFYGKSGTLDVEAHARQIAWVLAGQASGVTLLGLASEGASLTPDERKAVLRLTAQGLPAASTLLLTTRPDDDLRELAQIALESPR